MNEILFDFILMAIGLIPCLYTIRKLEHILNFLWCEDDEEKEQIVKYIGGYSQ